MVVPPWRESESMIAEPKVMPKPKLQKMNPDAEANAESKSSDAPDAVVPSEEDPTPSQFQ